MAKSQGITKKLSLWIAGSLVLLLILAFFFLNGFLTGIVKDYVGRELDRLNKRERYQLSIEDIKLNIFKGNLSLFEVAAKPKEEYLKLFDQGETDEKVLKELRVSKAEIKGISLFNFIWDKDLDIRDILVDELYFNIYRPGEEFKLKGIEKEKKTSFSLDSIRLPGISSVELSQISVENYQLNILNWASKDTLSSYLGESLIFNGLALKPSGDDKPYFEIDDSGLELGLRNQVFNLSGGLYSTGFETLHFSVNTGRLSLTNFSFKPQANKEVFSTKNSYTYEIFDVEIKEFDMHGVNTTSLISSGAISLDSISIDSMAVSIFKDKTKPFNTGKHKLLINEQLKNINQPLHVKNLKVSNSGLKYAELLPKNQKLLELELSNLSTTVNYITSVRDSMQSGKSMDVLLEADLMGAVPLKINLNLPYASETNSFTFSGNTYETASFTELNSIVHPALGIRFTGGRLNGMEFNARGNPHAIQGELAMYYKDLEIDLDIRKDKENKSINWVANSFVKSSNPNKKGKIIVGSMEYERVYYKGLGNYLWKSVQTGIVNSFNPVGNRTRKK